MALEPGRFTPGARPGEPGYDPGNGGNRPVPGVRSPTAIPGQPGYDPGNTLIPGTARPIQVAADPHTIQGPGADQPHLPGQKDDPTVRRK